VANVGRALLVFLIAAAVPGLAQADSGTRTGAGHPVRLGAGAGGLAALNGPADWGPAAQAELYPGGRFGRFGGRVEIRGFEAAAVSWITAGITYEAAAARPRLQLALHGGAGAAEGRRPVLGGGVHTQLWIVGPLWIGFDSGAWVVIDGIDTTLALTSSVTIRVAR
jgi:hypothetical protein